MKRRCMFVPCADYEKIARTNAIMALQLLSLSQRGGRDLF